MTNNSEPMLSVEWTPIRSELVWEGRSSRGQSLTLPMAHPDETWAEFVARCEQQILDALVRAYV